MKPIISAVAASFISMACLNASIAKENPNEFKDVNPNESAALAQKSNISMQQVSRASKIMGTAVKNPNGDKLGDIMDLVVNPENGQIVYAVVAFGGVMGMGDKLFAIPWRALNWQADKAFYALKIDQSTLKTAPGFDKNHWPDSSDSWDLQREGLNQFYGVAP